VFSSPSIAAMAAAISVQISSAVPAVAVVAAAVAGCTFFSLLTTTTALASM